MKIPNSYKKDIPLVLYGAGRTAGFVYESFLKHGIKAVCFVDSDKSKQGKPPYRGSNLITCSIDEVKASYHKFQIYVTISSTVKFSVFDFLTNTADIDKQHILNYESYIKRYSCKFLENRLQCSQHRILYCCHPRGKVSVPEISYSYGDEIIALEKFFRIRDKTINGLQNGTTEFCKGCSFLDEIFVPENKHYITDLTFGSSSNSICNLRCVYCACSKNNTVAAKASIHYLIFTEYLEKKCLISPEFTTIVISDGELTILPNRKELFSLLSRYNSQILTNAVIYSEEIAKMLAAKKTKILVSVDAGTRQTFQKIKGKDAFDIVRNNLIKYGKTNGNIVLKYIFLPGINDNENEFDDFLRLCKDVNVNQIRLSLDYNYDYTLFKSSGLFEKILICAAKCRKEGFLIDATEMYAFMKPELDAIMKNGV